MTDASERVVVVEVKDRTTHVAFSVTDHGSGIVADLESKLFEPFYSTKAEGMGMGLNICRSIIEFHHGRLWARNNQAGGSTFYFSLPKSLEANAVLP
jgi:signal transduction histidine kinase